MSDHTVMCCEKCIEEIAELQAKIDKALKAAPKNTDRVYHRNFPVYIHAMVRALKGGEK